MAGSVDDTPFDANQVQATEGNFNFQNNNNRGLEGFQHSVIEDDAEYRDGRASIMVGYKKNANVKFEDFQIVTLLGRGTFGKVFLAQLPIENNRQFAIKAIRKDVLLDFK